LYIISVTRRARSGPKLPALSALQVPETRLRARSTVLVVIVSGAAY
jgi:hypothetical protein